MRLEFTTLNHQNVWILNRRITYVFPPDGNSKLVPPDPFRTQKWNDLAPTIVGQLPCKDRTPSGIFFSNKHLRVLFFYLDFLIKPKQFLAKYRLSLGLELTITYGPLDRLKCDFSLIFWVIKRHIKFFLFGGRAFIQTPVWFIGAWIGDCFYQGASKTMGVWWFMIEADFYGSEKIMSFWH